MKLYICHTYYHVLITLIKAMNQHSEEKLDIILANDIPQINILAERLKSKQIFRQVFVFDEIYVLNRNHYKSRLDYDLHTRKRIRKLVDKVIPINIKTYSDIYIYNDRTRLGEYLNLKKCYYHLLEDALDFYSFFIQYYDLGNKFLKKYSFENIERRLFTFQYWSMSKYTLDIEVNSNKNIDMWDERFFVVPRKELFTSLNDNERKVLYAIFVGDKTFDYNRGKNVILLTQPLFQDGWVSSLDEQIMVFERIVKEYVDKQYCVTIKPHPRDIANYSDVIQQYNCLYIDKNIPSEILNYEPEAVYDVAVSITSTAINFLENVHTRRFWGKENI